MQGATEVGSKTAVTLYAPGQAHQALDFVRKVLLLRRVVAVVEQRAAEAFKFGCEARQQAPTPVIGGHQRYRTGVAILQGPIGCCDRLVFGRQCKLVKARRWQRVVGQVVKCQDGNGDEDVVSKRGDVLLEQWANDEFGAVGDCGGIS